MTAVRGRRVLIVEDEFLLAHDLTRYFTSMGAEVLGPAANVLAASAHVEFADAAVLDIDLNGQKVYPIADELARRGIPFVFYSGCGDIAIPSRFQHAGHLSKPFDGGAVFETLFPEAAGARPVAATADDVYTILPKLRLAALLLVSDTAAADRLVELTLEQALAFIETRGEHADLEGWLASFLEETHLRRGRELMV